MSAAEPLYGWRSMPPAPPCPACAGTREQLIDAGVLRPAPPLSPLSAELDGAAYLPLDAAGRASAAASVEGRINDQHLIDVASGKRAPRRNRRD